MTERSGKMREILCAVVNAFSFAVQAITALAKRRKQAAAGNLYLDLFALIHEDIEHLDSVDRHEDLLECMDRENYETEHYTFRKELYTLVLGEMAFIRIAHGIKADASLEECLEHIGENAGIIRETIRDPSYCVVFHLLKGGWFFQQGRVEEFLEELERFAAVTAEFKYREDSEYVAAMKECIDRKDSPRVMETFRKRAITLFRHQFTCIRQGMLCSSARAHHWAGEPAP